MKSAMSAKVELDVSAKEADPNPPTDSSDALSSNDSLLKKTHPQTTTALILPGEIRPP